MADHKFCMEYYPSPLADYMKDLLDTLSKELAEKVRESLSQFIEERERERDSLAEELQGNYF